MRQRSSAIAASWLVALAACADNYGADEVLQSTHSHIPPIAKQAAQMGPVDGNMQLNLSVALPLRNEAELDVLLAQLNDAQSEQFGNFLSPQQFATRFHPTAEQVAEVRAALLDAHLVPDAAAHGCLLGVHGRAADVETAFKTALYHFTGYDGQQFVAPTAEPQTPAGLAVVAVNGLVSGMAPKALYHRLDAPARVGGQKGAHILAGLQNYLTPAVTRGVYNVPATATGEGQTIGLFQMDTYDPADVALFAQRFSLPAPHIESIRLDGSSSTVSDPNVQVEVQLDIMMAMTMAPEANIRIYQGNNAGGAAGYQYYLNVFNEMANPTQGDRLLVRSLSTSYGYFEAQLPSASLQSENTIFKQMAAQGQTLFSAAGDSGAYGYDSQNAQVVTVIDPAVQPYVCGVGGTSVRASTSNTYGSETGWSDGGGGISRFWATPGYQAAISQLPSVGSATLRNAPDVAMDADPTTGFQMVYQGQVAIVGGTSAAAPLWAGVHALINQRRQGRSEAPLGFFNPILYRLAASAPGAILHDITQGNNGVYAATAGYDNVTGWGTPNVAAVLDAFAQGYARIPLFGPSWLYRGAEAPEGSHP